MNLTEERKSFLIESLNSIRNKPFYCGQRMRFYLDGELVGEGDMPEGSFDEHRFMVAELAGVEKFNDFEFVNKDGKVTRRGSDVGIDQFNLEDRISSDTDYGKYHGRKYEIWKANNQLKFVNH